MSNWGAGRENLVAYFDAHSAATASARAHLREQPSDRDGLHATRWSQLAAEMAEMFTIADDDDERSFVNAVMSIMKAIERELPMGEQPEPLRERVENHLGRLTFSRQ